MEQITALNLVIAVLIFVAGYIGRKFLDFIWQFLSTSQKIRSTRRGIDFYKRHRRIELIGQLGIELNHRSLYLILAALIWVVALLSGFGLQISDIASKLSGTPESHSVIRQAVSIFQFLTEINFLLMQVRYFRLYLYAGAAAVRRDELISKIESLGPLGQGMGAIPQIGSAEELVWLWPKQQQ